jgi:hypothetical protein
MIDQLNIADAETKAKAHKALLNALNRKDVSGLKVFITKVAGTAAEKGIGVLINKLFPIP